jgi:hypothetical protein
VSALSVLRLVRPEEELRVTIQLEVAQLCPESTCQAIYTLHDGPCPKCGNAEGLPLEQALNRRTAAGPLADAVKGLLLRSRNLSARERRELVQALETAGVKP